MAQLLSRAVLIVVCTVAGYVLNHQLELIQPPAVGLVGGFGLALFVLLIETVLKKFSLKQIMGGTIGMVLGLAMAFLISYPLGRFLDSVPLAVSVYVITACMFGYMGVTLGSGKVGEFRPGGRGWLGHSEAARDKGVGDKLLDTSALIDGRIADVVETGFADGRLLVPRFVLAELQAVADSADAIKRQRGRRGLEILNRLKSLPQARLVITDDDGLGQVDQLLVSLARQRGAAIVTVDFNLNQVASLQGVKVLNVNLLAQAVKPVILPGEVFSLQVVKEGKSPGQGVGYLEDGTMVVIENGRRHIGQEVEVEAVSTLQTTAGRMIFTELASVSRSGPPQARAG